MKISYDWLKDYLECDLAPQQVADIMTSIGIEVDSLEQTEAVPGGLAGVVVAEVLKCEPHPDSDHLHITKVNDGGPEALTVVCGAPNVAAGQKVLFAQIGAVLPGDFKIKKSKIRGVESFGMICAEDELGIGTSHDGIMVLPADAPWALRPRSISTCPPRPSSNTKSPPTAWTPLPILALRATCTLTLCSTASRANCTGPTLPPSKRALAPAYP